MATRISDPSKIPETAYCIYVFPKSRRRCKELATTKDGYCIDHDPGPWDKLSKWGPWGVRLARIGIILGDIATGGGGAMMSASDQKRLLAMKKQLEKMASTIKQKGEFTKLEQIDIGLQLTKMQAQVMLLVASGKLPKVRKAAAKKAPAKKKKAAAKKKKAAAKKKKAPAKKKAKLKGRVAKARTR